MALYHAYDSAYPPEVHYPGCQAAFGYLGGNTPHVWTRDEWNRATDDGRLRCMGIWTLDFGKSPITQAVSAHDAAADLGWLSGADVVRLLTLDGETSQDKKFIEEVASHLRNLGYEPVDYRSLDAILNAPTDNLIEWVADWSAPPGAWTPKQSIIQYAPNLPWADGEVDLSVMDSYVWEHLGRGPRR